MTEDHHAGDNQVIMNTGIKHSKPVKGQSVSDYRDRTFSLVLLSYALYSGVDVSAL